MDDELTIGSLTFDDDDYVDTLRVSDACSNSTIYSTDSDCAIDFDLQDVIDDDDLFEATLTVTPSTSAGVQTYDLRFVADLTTNDELTYTSEDSDDDSSSSSGGSFGIVSLLLLALLSWWRMNLNVEVCKTKQKHSRVIT
jgi:hypothetical protein